MKTGKYLGGWAMIAALLIPFTGTGQDWERKGQVLFAESGAETIGSSLDMPDPNTLAIGAYYNDASGVDAGQVRIYFWDGTEWTLKGEPINGGAVRSYFGYSLSMPDAHTIAIGAVGYNDFAGQVHVYTWDGTRWIQKGSPISGASSGDRLGISLSMPDPQTLAIGAIGYNDFAGQVRVYTWDGTRWIQKGPDANTIAVSVRSYNNSAGQVRIYWWNGTRWVQKGSPLNGQNAIDFFGRSLSMPNSNTIAIGAPYYDSDFRNSGQVRIFSWNGTEWTQKGNPINGLSRSEHAGYFVSMPSEDIVAIGVPNSNVNGTWSGEVRIFKWNGMSWIPYGFEIKGKNKAEQFGISVVMADTNTLVAGAIGYDGGNVHEKGSLFLRSDKRGQVRVFTKRDSVWVQKGHSIDGQQDRDQFGHSVSMPDANTIAVGAPYNDGNTHNPDDERGQVRIFQYDEPQWVLKGNAITGAAPGDESGWSVSMPDANTVAIGSPSNDDNGVDAGHVRIFSWNGSEWIQKGEAIEGEAPGDAFGWSVSMPDPNTVAIGTPYNDGAGTDAGHVRIFSWNGYAWIQKGQDIDGLGPYFYCGFSVSMPDANTVAIGSIGSDIANKDAGHVRIFSWNGSTWEQKGYTIVGTAATDNSGFSVSMPDANTVAIGAIYNDGAGIGSGQVSIFTWDGNEWTQKGRDIYGEKEWDRAGWSVSMPDPNTVAVGSRYSDDLGANSNSGHVRIFKWNGTDWIQKGKTLPGTFASESGFSVTMPDSNTVAFGGPSGSTNRQYGGEAQIYHYAKPITTHIASHQTTNGEILLNAHTTATHLLIRIHTSSEDKAVLSLFHHSGKPIFLKYIRLKKGYNIIPLPMSQLPRGVYLVQLKSDRGIHLTQQVLW